MNMAEASHALAGCHLAPIDASTCERYVSWLLGEENADAPKGAIELVWALVHCDDGVTWGRYDVEKQAWHLGSQAAPDVSPPIHQETLQELRLFSEAGEVLIWRTDEGLRGRVLGETDPAADRGYESNTLRPSDESRILRGGRVVTQCEHGFTHIGDRSGAEQVLPLAASDEQLQAAQIRLGVRHYYEADQDTGAVRIAATRLVKLTAGGTHGA